MCKKITIYFSLIFLLLQVNSFAQDLANDLESEKEYLNQISGGVINNPFFPRKSIKYSPFFHAGYRRKIENFYLRGAFNFASFSNPKSNLKINFGIQHIFNINKNLKLSYATDIVYARTNLTEYIGLAPNVGFEYFITKQVSLSTEYGLGWARTTKDNSDLFVLNRLLGIVINYSF